MRALIARLKEAEIPYRENVAGGSLCTFRIGGVCRLVVEPRCLGELITVLRLCVSAGRRFYLIGNGSDLLISDSGCEEPLIRTVQLAGIRRIRGGLRVLCGTSLACLLQVSIGLGSGELLHLAGIPGTLGGAVLMNAGTEGNGILDHTVSVEAFDPETGIIRTIFHEKCDSSYRNSVFQHNSMVILSADLALTQTEAPEELRARLRARLQARRAAQPLELPSAGSVFRRPSPELPLSPLIDRLGLKGRQIGGAAVSVKHAGFIVNLGGATAADVLALIREIQKKVEGSVGIRPECELRMIPEGHEFFTDGKK